MGATTIEHRQQMLREAVITLRLGATVFHFSSSEYIDDIKYRLKRSIDRHLTFPYSRKKQLHTYLLRKLDIPENIDVMKAELALLNPNQKYRVRHILISIAFADDNITISKKEHMEKLYFSLGLDKAMLADDIHFENPVRIINKPNKKVENIGFPLNIEALKLHEEEDKKSKAFLTDVFSDVESMQPEQLKKSLSTPYIVINEAPSNEKYEALYKKLITKEQWDYGEFRHLCNDYIGMTMIKGAVEFINNWVYEYIEASAPVLDIDEKKRVILIDAETVEEIGELVD